METTERAVFIGLFACFRSGGSFLFAIRRRCERQTTRCSGMAQARRGSRRSHAHAGNQAPGKGTSGGSRLRSPYGDTAEKNIDTVSIRRPQAALSHFRDRLFLRDVAVQGTAALYAGRTHDAPPWRSGMAQNPLRNALHGPRTARQARTHTNTLPRCSGAILAAPGVHGEAQAAARGNLSCSLPVYQAATWRGARCRHPHRQAPTE